MKENETKQSKRVALRTFEELDAMTGPWTFDLSNNEFVNYFQNRTGYLITECECGWAEVVNLLLYPTDNAWKLTRAKIQDCWEIFTQ